MNYDSFFSQSGFNDAGQTAFFALGGGMMHRTIKVLVGRLRQPRAGSPQRCPAPGTPLGVTFREFVPSPVTINNAGQTAFEAWLTGDGVDDSNGEGVWSEGSGTLELVARRGSPAPGTASGVNFGAFNPYRWPLLNDAGQTAFCAVLTGSGVAATTTVASGW